VPYRHLGVTTGPDTYWVDLRWTDRARSRGVRAPRVPTAITTCSSCSASTRRPCAGLLD